MKRGNRAWPKSIVEIGTKRPDPRADPQATQKITREQLDEALKRTKSGTRPITRAAVRPDPRAEYDSLTGPRDDDDAPQITIVKIDSMELSVIDPASLLPSHETDANEEQRSSGVEARHERHEQHENDETSQTSLSSSVASVAVSGVTLTARQRAATFTQRLRARPQLAFFAGLAIVAFIALAAVIGFFAGRITGH